MKTIVLAVVLGSAAYAQPTTSDSAGPAETYQNYCAGCHGAQMEGGQHSALRKTSWMYGGNRAARLRTVMYGIAGTEMAAWSQVLPKPQLEALVDYILLSRDTLPPTPDAKPDTIQTADYLVHIETVVAEGGRGTVTTFSRWVRLRGGTVWTAKTR